MKPTVVQVLNEASAVQLDYWVAEYVLGYRCLLYPWSRSKRYLASPGDQELFKQPARGDEPVIDSMALRLQWSHDMGHAWEVIESVRKWPEGRQMRFLSAITMQNETSLHPLAWLAFVAKAPATALCKAAVIASV
jgi:hypothetical protein